MSGKRKLSTVATTWQLAEPFASELGLSIWDIQYMKEGASWYLRIFIDKPSGVTIDDCEKMSRAINAPLDEENFIPQQYYLEVSSPGLERKLVRDEHFNAKIGENVLVRMIQAIDDERDFKGTLADYTNGMITLTFEDNDESMTVDSKDTSWVKLDDFGGF